jgi:hypothetical protein
MYTVTKTFLMLHHHQVDLYVVIRNYSVPFSTYGENQDRHTGDFVERTGDFFRTAAYSTYDVYSKMVFRHTIGEILKTGVRMLHQTHRQL